MDNQQSQGLLSSNDGGSECDETVYEKYRENAVISRKTRIHQLLPFALHVLIFVSYSVVFLIKSQPKPQAKLWPDIYNDLPFHETTQRTVHHTEFEGRPTAASEKAWEELLSVGIVSITQDEESRLPFDTAANVFREHEYVVELNVFHQLHCLHGLRQQIWNPRQISWKDNERMTWWEFHMNHCIEHLRQSLICHADITPQRFIWDDENYSYALDQEQQSKCRSWEDIWSWAQVRNTTGDYPSNLKGLEKNGKNSDAGEVWTHQSAQSA